VTVWKAVEPISIDFDVTVGGHHNYPKNSSNRAQSQVNPGITRAELEAQIRTLAGVEKRAIGLVATQLGLSGTTVRRMCRTLQIGPYEGKDPDLVKSRSSQVPFGWSVESGILIQNPAEWPWVLKAHELRKSGLSLHKIAAHFTERRVPTKNGGRWFARTIKQILEFNSRHIKHEKIKQRRSKWESKS
jgi:hypothetical protein